MASLSARECYALLGLREGAGLDDIKGAFRKQAFKLHPDLNPSKDAAAQFRRLNEAYVFLTKTVEADRSAADRAASAHAAAGGKAREREQARTSPGEGARAYRRQQQQAKAEAHGAARGAAGRKASGKRFYFKEEEVLQDILKDPFARQVFDDIYSQIRKERPGWTPPRSMKKRRLELSWGGRRIGLDLGKGGLKAWLRGQFDHEQTVRFPAQALYPGRSVRISVHQKFSKGPKTVDVTLPPDFVIGRPLRLKGLGRRLGPIKGDLILRILAK